MSDSMAQIIDRLAIVLPAIMFGVSLGVMIKK